MKHFLHIPARLLLLLTAGIARKTLHLTQETQYLLKLVKLQGLLKGGVDVERSQVFFEIDLQECCHEHNFWLEKVYAAVL